MRTFFRHVRGFLSLMHQSCVTPAPSGEKHWQADMCIILTSSWTSRDSGKALPTCLLHYDHSTTADCSGVGRFSILGVGVPNLGIDWLTFTGGAMTLWGGGGTKHFKIIAGGVPGPCCPHPLFLRLWTVYSFNWRGGEFYLFYRASQFYTGYEYSTIWEASYPLTGWRWRMVLCWTGSL